MLVTVTTFSEANREYPNVVTYSEEVNSVVHASAVRRDTYT